MRLPYLILQHRTEVVTKGATRSAMPRAAATAHAAPTPRVLTDELNPREVEERAKDRSVDCVAPVIPMKLISPVATATAASRAAGPTWGVRAVGADKSSFSGEGVVVAVLDTGIDSNHPAFSGVELITKNFTKESDADQHGHGTHCAGTIFGREIDGVRIGVAPGVKKALIGKVLGRGGGDSGKIVEAVNWAVSSGANVISMSLGIDFPGFVKQLEKEGIPTELATSMALEGYRTNVILFERLAGLIAAQNAFTQTAVLIAAAGNESARDRDPDFEIGVAPPAVATGFVSVAAVGEGANGFTIAPFSNVGARVAAPGVDILSAKIGGGLAGMSGTSMATPHVAGVAALWVEKLRKEGRLNGELLVNALVGNAKPDGLARDVTARHVGAGVVRAPLN